MRIEQCVGRTWSGLDFFATVLTTMMLVVPSAAADPPAPDEALSVDGIWQREVNSPNGPVRLVKEHRQGKTIVTANDQQGNVLYQHRSEYRLERSGKVHVLTFFNRTITAGPDQGQVTKGPIAFIYRIKGDQFIEVRGVLDDDPSAPAMIEWKRAKPTEPAKDAAG